VLSLPGWSVKKFVKTGGCSYDADDVAAAAALAKAAATDGVVILTAHGPPRGPNKTSLDATFDYGNVGDEALAALLQQTNDDGVGLVRFGFFSHILEAGGRVTADAQSHAPMKLPMKKPSSTLYLNAGSASASGLELHGKKTSRGMMALVTIDDLAGGGRGSAKFITLRK
jgi:hypothetical protein